MGPVVPGPPFEIGAPPFHVWTPGCCIHPIQYFENVAPPSGFWPHLLLNPCDGPEILYFVLALAANEANFFLLLL